MTRYASELGIDVSKAELDIRARYDGRGKLGMDDVSPACELLWYKWDIESDAGPEQVQELLTQIDRGCHTLNSLRYPVRIEGQSELNGEPLRFQQLASQPNEAGSAHPRAAVGPAGPERPRPG
ncbi:MAG: OsmC family protein [Chloroflexota bacterium]|nr:OsmC family protein [Chloroflexota bacterium]